MLMNTESGEQNSKVHIKTGPVLCHLWESNAQGGDRLWVDAKPANLLDYPGEQSESWGFTSRSKARVILGQVLRIVTCGGHNII